MPGLPKQNGQFRDVSASPRSSGKVSTDGIWSKHRNEITFDQPRSSGKVSTDGIWSKNRNEITFDQLQKFWNELPPEARKELMRIDKPTLFEQARKNLYCSRCNGLLLEGFSHIVMYGKSLQQEDGVALHITTSRPGPSINRSDDRTNTMHLSCRDDDIQDPSVHPWGGLVACRDGILTLLDCFLDAKSLKALHNVFDSARMRERERKLLYPDACGGGGRGWISQGMANYGRGHGGREACALHTARLPCDTLVGFWSALGDETQQSLLRMKEEDFMERLMYRFESKRFCRDCRRNVIREFKELKELKRMRRETRCTNWFCVADVAFEYEVSDSKIQADWHQSFADTIKIYHHFEWAVGTGEGKSDIMEFKDVGMHGSVHANDLDLSDLTECFITLRAWKLDGRCNEYSVKAHALKGQPCVHRRLLVGGGFVTITKGECISRFFEQAEEAEEEEDDDSMDKDGNEVDGEGSRLQKHAKSPELAREFLLDAATVIFKEQVEKAFREGTARQNAHSVFVCLALKLLEERLHVACKEITTLEKQIKLLEEEEKEKREEEERKERRKTKDREKRLRRKERLKGKDKEREEKCIDSKQNSVVPEMTEENTAYAEEESYNCNNSEDSISEPGDLVLDKPLFSDTQNEPSSGGCVVSKLGTVKDDMEHSCQVADRKLSVKNVNGTFMIDQSKSSNWKLRFRNEHQLDPASKLCSRNRSVVDDESGDLGDESEPRFHGGYMETPSRCNTSVNRQPRSNPLKSNTRIGGPKYGEKFYSSNYRVRDRFDVKSCGCNLQNDYKTKDGPHVVSGREIKTKFESSSDMSRPLYRRTKYSQGSFLPDSCRIPKSKQVWEPVEPGKKYPRSNSDSDITTSSSTFKIDGCEEGKNDGSGCRQPDNLIKSSGDPCLSGISKNSDSSFGSNNYHSHEDNSVEDSNNSSVVTNDGCHKGLIAGAKNDSDPTLSNTSNSDNCSPCLSEGDNSVVCSSSQNADSISTSDSEDASQKAEGNETSKGGQNESRNCSNDGGDERLKTDEGKFFTSRATTGRPEQGNFPGDPATTNSHNPDKNRITVSTSSQSHCLLPSLHNPPMPYPVFPAPSTMAYYHQRPTSWPATPANGLISFPQPNCYLFTSPLGYGLPENPSSHFCMQYSGIQPFPNPVLDMGQLPTFQMVNKANGMNYEEQTRNSKLGGAKDSIVIPDTGLSDRHVEKPAANCQEQSPLGDFAASGKDSKNFSLFHFGGPVAVSTGCGNTNEVSRKEGIVVDTFSNSPTIPSQADFACTGKETTGEEYSLFAASNGIRFPFF